MQTQINEVKVILTDNISKVLERGDRLDDLIGKSDDLQASVSGLNRNVSAFPDVFRSVNTSSLGGVGHQLQTSPLINDWHGHKVPVLFLW